MPTYVRRVSSRLALVLALFAAFGVAACSPRSQPASVFEPTEVAGEVLAFVNEARASARTCGDQSFPAVPPLALEARLSAAAQAHSEDMYANTFMGHVGSDGSSFIQRAERHDYDWSALAENVAFGYADAQSVMTGWLSSPGHCKNIMNGRVTQLGVGLAGAYWTQLFGAPS